MAYSISQAPWGGTSTAPRAMMKPKSPRAFFDTEGTKPGFRQPVIDGKLSKLYDVSKSVPHDKYEQPFRHLYAESAIEILGDYNPLYSKRPKKLVMALLSRVEMGKSWNNFTLIGTGLMYAIPGLPGVRSQRCRITVAAWELLEHWAERFPQFEKHWLAYNDNKAKAQIYSDCFDLALGHRPASFVAIDLKVPEYQTKLEARLYREMMKEQKRVAEKEMRLAAEKKWQEMMMQQTAQKEYQDAIRGQLGGQHQHAVGVYDPNLSAIAMTSGGYVPTTLTSDTTLSVAKPKGILKGILGMS
jgi:hypothetical protein